MISRYEIKFRVNHEQKVRFLEAARFGLQADPHGTNACYRVSSVYFDSRNLDYYWQKVDGVAIRKKLRLRFYGDVERAEDLDDRPCFLELKHRLKDSVYKERVRLTPKGVRHILEDARCLRDIRDFVADEDLDKRTTIATLESLEAVMDFEAANLITYQREAWLGQVDGRLRVTFDQMAHAYNPDGYNTVSSRFGLPVIPAGHYVMEIKFNETFPRWIRDIVSDQNLLPRRFSKYAAGIETLRRVDSRCQSNLWALDAGIGAEGVEASDSEAMKPMHESPMIAIPQVGFGMPSPSSVR